MSPLIPSFLSVFHYSYLLAPIGISFNWKTVSRFYLNLYPHTHQRFLWLDMNPEWLMSLKIRLLLSFSKGSYATLRNLKYFYKTVDGEKSPSNSLIIRRALDLLDTTISSMRDKSSILTEYECLQSLIDPNYRSRRIECK